MVSCKEKTLNNRMSEKYDKGIGRNKSVHVYIAAYDKKSFF